jgi:electron transfer flavoprotein-quinone oxidoreductase
MYAGQSASAAIDAGNVSAASLKSYTDRLNETFVLQDHKKLRKIPHLVLSDRVQHKYPSFVTGVVERMFRVDNPTPKPGVRRIVNQERKKAGIKLSELVRDALTGLKGFG